VLWIDEAVSIFRVLTGNRRHEDAGWKRKRGVGDELLRRHHLASRDAGLVGRDALDVLDGAPFKPFRCLLPILYTARALQECGSARPPAFAPCCLLFVQHPSPKYARPQS